MYGFIGSFGKEKINDFCIEQENKYEIVKDEFENDYIKIKRLTTNKFLADKLFYENEQVIIVIEGIIYNFTQLENKYNTADRNKLILKLIELYNDDFVKKLNGNFSLIIYDKELKKINIYTSHTVYRPIFYYQYNNGILFSTDIHWLYKTIINNNHKLMLNIDAAYCLLSYGYMIDEITLVEGVYRLMPGNMLSLEYWGGNLQECLS